VLIVVEEGGQQRLVDIVVNDRDATFSHVATAVGIDSDRDWWADGSAIDASNPMQGLIHHGSVIADVAPAIDPTQTIGLFLEQIAGSDVGWIGELRLGPNVLGRSPDVELFRDDLSTSGRHCRLERRDDDSVLVTDLGSRNGTRVGGRRVEAAELGVDQLLWAGSGVYRLRRFEPSRPFLAASGSGEFGRVSFNRPPRQSRAEARLAVEAPAVVSPAAGPSPSLSVAAILAPIVMAGAMVLVLGSLRFALFALLSPVIAVATWFENRHRAKKAEKSHAERTASATLEFAKRIDAEVELEHHRRWVEQPDPAELLRWLSGPSTRLWERRCHDPDAMCVSVGVADVAWTPEIAGDYDESAFGTGIGSVLSDVPVAVGLRAGEVVGIVGPTDAARRVGRALLLGAVATSGPSDLRVAVIASDDAVHDWGWAAWLPHLADVDSALGRPWVIRSDELDAAAAALERAQLSGFGLIAVDATAATSLRNSVARQLFSRQQSAWGGIVVAEREDQLPSECTCVVTIEDDNGRATVRLPRAGIAYPDVQTVGVSRDTAVATARACARLEDPDLPVGASLLPRSIALGDIDSIDRARSDSSLTSLPCVLGVGTEGNLSIDLVTDGPHALIAGTTGSGKSELLRTLVTSLAANTSPRELNFVLIDYKGGSAFDATAELPHVVGMVTDLDDHLGARALVCLEAELEHRERELRAAGVGDISAVSDSGLARLVVVIDEFATLAAELPDFLDSLVGIAQRGRSLGVHLVLATQRPAGAVSDNIRANTNLRICLRVQDAADSVDVIGVDDASRLPRSVPGRALARFGHGDTLVFQGAHVTGPTAAGVARPVELASEASAVSGDSTLVAVLSATSWSDHTGSGVELRRPWPDALPTELDAAALDDLAEVGAHASETLVVAVGDDPAGQRWIPFGWDLAVGNLLVLGARGSGASRALDAVVCAATKRWSPAELHVHRIELLAPTEPQRSSPHFGGVAGLGDDEKLSQLVHRHVAAIDARIASGNVGGPRLLLVVDHLGGLLNGQQSTGGLELIESIRRVWVEGPSVNVHMVVAADRAGAVPTAWSSAVAQKWLFRLADPSDYQMAGLRAAELPTFSTGRGVSSDGLEFQLVDADSIGPPLSEPAHAGPRRLRSLGDGVERSELPSAVLGSRPWRVPVGLDSTTLELASLEVHEGENVLVAGPARSGVSSALGLIGAQLAVTRDVVAVCHGPAGDERNAALVASLRGMIVHDSIASAAEAVAAAGGTCVVVIDDADKFDGAIEALLSHEGVACIVAGGRADQLRTRFGHWTGYARSSRTGLLLRPDVDLDGDLFGIRLDRSIARPVRPGAGVVIVEGVGTTIQVAH